MFVLTKLKDLFADWSPLSVNSLDEETSFPLLTVLPHHFRIAQVVRVRIPYSATQVEGKSKNLTCHVGY